MIRSTGVGYQQLVFVVLQWLCVLCISPHLTPFTKTTLVIFAMFSLQVALFSLTIPCKLYYAISQGMITFQRCVCVHYIFQL